MFTQQEYDTMKLISRTGKATGIPQLEDYLAAPAAEHPIHITSGEGENGTTEVFAGKRTERAVKLRLTRERCGGDRWARAAVFMREVGDGAAIGMNVETGTEDYFPDAD
jgi:hypothetical protein